MNVRNVTDASFRKYGKVAEGYDCTRLLKEMEHTPLPEGVIYEPSEESLELLPVAARLRDGFYGGLPIQVGYCNGKNKRLNALEYHRSSELNLAVTDMILMVGSQQDLEEDDTYDTSKVEAFLVPAGTLVELYATTLHYAPCHVEEGGFRCAVVLPRGTNTPIDFTLKTTGEERLMTARNKWLIAHKEAGIEGAFCGLKGANLSL